MRKVANDFVRDAKALGKSVKAVFVAPPKPPTKAQRQQATNMAGAGGLSGRRRDSARQQYLDNAIGTTPPKPRNSGRGR